MKNFYPEHKKLVRNIGQNDKETISAVRVYPITPVAKPRMTRRDKWLKRECVMNYRAFKDECREHGLTIPERCKIIFNLAMPESWSGKKRRKYYGQSHKKRPDLDNLIKGITDAVLEEDSHIWRIHAEKRWALESSIVIEVEE